MTVQNYREITIRKQHLRLLSQKAIYWEEQKALLLADLHIGKAGHFRKNGIPVPNQLNQTNLTHLDILIEHYKPDKLILLGDLFHSKENLEWHQFEKWKRGHRTLSFILVTGNHDILPDQLYHSSGIHLFKKLRVRPFLFVHDPDDHTENRPGDNSYLLCGHIHPAVQLKGKGRQSMKLPCFFFGRDSGVLPAFGQFTGTHVIRPGADDRVFAITDNQVVAFD